MVLDKYFISTLVKTNTKIDTKKYLSINNPGTDFTDLFSLASSCSAGIHIFYTSSSTANSPHSYGVGFVLKRTSSSGVIVLFGINTNVMYLCPFSDLTTSNWCWHIHNAN